MEERFQIFTVLVANLNRCIYRIKTDVMAEYNLKSSHVSCLYYLYKHGPLTATELCGLCGEDKSNVSRTIKYLEEEGYLLNNSKTNKKYLTPIELSTKGKEIGKRLSIKVDEILNYASFGLSDEDRKIMYDSLNLINERLNKLCNDYDKGNSIHFLNWLFKHKGEKND